MHRQPGAGARLPIRIRILRYTAGGAALLLAAGCASSGNASAGAANTSAINIPATYAPSSAAASPSPSPSPSPSVDPGTLPQTHVLPNPDDPLFQAGVQDLWQAIVTNDPATALPFFFPKSAYLQVKAISNPSADYKNRLIAWYDLDIAAAHKLLGADAATAQLVGVSVPTKQAQWIVPGVEYNKGSYYRVYGTRLTYKVGGKTKSFGIFSLISWRGEWYVVHLGPSTRTSLKGYVYAPEG
jgi:hypothetical protein